ncbi:MAG TPA: SHOCT domain-containing protein [Solirubrobacteraceae bacterium]|nr:SHOCT domain-containing protein [Solirubrobacteraceae bacterium]
MATDGTPIPPELAGGNALKTVYPECSTARLYAAAIHCVTELGCVITSRDDAAMTLAFRTNPVRPWPGIELAAAIHPEDDGAQIVLGGRHVTGYRLGMADWHQANALGLMFLDRLTSELPGIPEPAAGPSAVPSTVSRLKSLAELRDRGALTEDEFQAQKKRLLDLEPVTEQ